MSWRSTAFFRGGLAVALAGFWGTNALAEEPPEAKGSINPYINAKVTDEGKTVDLGIESYPAASSLGWRLTASVKKEDEDEPPAEISSEGLDIGLRLQVLTEFGEGPRSTRKESTSTASISRWGVGLEGRWGVSQFAFNPAGGEETTRTEHSLSLAGKVWWFGSVGQAVNLGTRPVETEGNAPAIVRTVYAARLIQPQVTVSYARTWEAAEDAYLVRPVQPDGLQLAEKMKLEPPSATPKLSIQFALPYEPPKNVFAYGPAIRFTTKGAANGVNPFGAVGRLRLEFWTYWYSFTEGPAVRVGVAPFLDVRTGGTDKRPDWVGGGVIEFRTSVSRLEY